MSGARSRARNPTSLASLLPPPRSLAGCITAVHLADLTANDMFTISRLRMTTRDLEEPAPPPHRNPLVRAGRCAARGPAAIRLQLGGGSRSHDRLLSMPPPAPESLLATQVVQRLGAARAGPVRGGVDGVCHWVSRWPVGTRQCCLLPDCLPASSAAHCLLHCLLLRLCRPSGPSTLPS